MHLTTRKWRRHVVHTAPDVGAVFLSITSIFSILLLDSLVRGWWVCRRTRQLKPNLPPPLSLEQLKLAIIPMSIQGCFIAAEQWFRCNLQWSLELPLPGFLCIRRFVLIANEELLKHILVTQNARSEKHHAYGILEFFRMTTLPDSGVDAWKETHRLLSKFGKALPELCVVITPMIREWMDFHWRKSHSPPLDTAETLKDLYWKVVMILVLGDDAFANVYQEAWTTCMERLDSPAAFLFWWAKYIPSSLNVRYKQQTTQLRRVVRQAVDAAYNDVSSVSEWTFLHLLVSQPPSNRLSQADATEVLLEVLFTGASSVTTTLLWPLWQLATHSDAQTRAAQEVANTNVDTLLSSSPPKLPFWEACVRETLRLYSPIHVGRHCIEDDSFENIQIPKGTDIAANMWFIHRNSQFWPDPNEFDPNRWLDKPTNVKYYHPLAWVCEAVQERQWHTQCSSISQRSF